VEASESRMMEESESGTEGAELVDEPAAEVPAASGPVLVSTG
jgi:hypothetical protein